MFLPIRIVANQRWEAKIFARSKPRESSGCFHLIARSGTVRVKLTDGGSQPLGEQQLHAPNMLMAAVIGSELLAATLELIAGAEGFQGELSIEPAEG
jgi:hypothetical protein